MNTSYVTATKEELISLFEETHPAIKTLITGGELKKTSIALAEKHSVRIDKYIKLSNIITSVLIGALDPNNVTNAIIKDTEIGNEEALSLTKDLEEGIFEKARAITLGKPLEDAITLQFKGPRTPDELRKEIMSMTKKAPVQIQPKTTEEAKKNTVTPPGSRSLLLEQLQLLSSIPNDDEIAERLTKIQEQINSIKKVEEEDNSLHSKVPLKNFMFGEEGKNAVPAILKTSTYSVAPTRYNLDPYREVSEE